MNARAAAWRAWGNHWRWIAGYQRFLYIIGFILIASAVFHTGVLIATGGTLEGDVSWRKPIVFGEAFGITAVSIAWVMTFLPIQTTAGRLLAGGLGIANVGEVLWVSVQQWRGVPSHFNSDTALDELLFRAAGALIAITASVIFVVTVWSFVSLRASASMELAVRVGLLLISASQVFGFAMIVNDGNTIGESGAMKIPHALALHGLQVLPILAWLLLRAGWGESRRFAITAAGSAGYAGMVIVTASRAYLGEAPFDIQHVAGLGLLGCMALVVVAFALALPGLARAVRY